MAHMPGITASVSGVFVSNHLIYFITPGVRVCEGFCVLYFFSRLFVIEKVADSGEIKNAVQGFIRFV